MFYASRFMTITKKKNQSKLILQKREIYLLKNSVPSWQWSANCDQESS